MNEESSVPQAGEVGGPLRTNLTHPDPTAPFCVRRNEVCYRGCGKNCKARMEAEFVALARAHPEMTPEEIAEVVTNSGGNHGK